MSDSYIRPTDQPSVAADTSHGAEWEQRKPAPLNTMGANVIQKNWQELIRPNKLKVEAGADYGRRPSSAKSPETTVNVEYVSTNPTGPLHVAHARGRQLQQVLAFVHPAMDFRLPNDAGYTAQ